MNKQLDPYVPGRVHRMVTALLVAWLVAGMAALLVLSLLASGTR